MKKIIVFTIFIFTIVSCGNEDTQNSLCECVEAGKEVDRISASFFEREATKQGKDSLDAAIVRRDKICFPYQYMLSHELQQKAQDCENLKFTVEE